MKLKRKNRFIAFAVAAALLITLFAGLTTAFATDVLNAYDAKTEYMENPIGIGRTNPVFSWKISKGEARGIVQTSYHIVVEGDEGVVWDSGTVTSDLSNGIVYEGSPLQSGKQYSWTVTAADNQGASASTGGTFGMGLLDEAAWNGAQWISNTGGTPAEDTGAKTDPKKYAVECEFELRSGSLGLMFGPNTSNFYMWQINTVQSQINHGETNLDNVSASDVLMLRPHRWLGGGVTGLGEYAIGDNNAIKSMRTGRHTVRLEIDNGKVTTYLDGNKLLYNNPVGSTAARTEDYLDMPTASLNEIGGAGLRVCYTASNLDKDDLTLYKLAIYDSDGQLAYLNEFKDDNPLGYGDLQTGGGILLKPTEPTPGWLAWQKPGSAESQVPLMMKEFETQNQKIKRATVYASALGHYELNLNGQKVGEEFMAPGWTEYEKRVQYQAYDVTAQLTQGGKNRIGAMIAPGWYSGNISSIGKNRYGETQALIANMVIEYENGDTQSVATDGTWFYSLDGPILSTDMFDGETYDARREQGGEKYGWTKPDYNAAKWGKVGVMYSNAYGAKTHGKTMALTAQIGPTVKKIKEVNPVSITEVKGKWIVDMGQNFAGIAEMSLKGTAGKTAKIRYGEMLNDSEKGVRGCDNADGPGSLYTANLRSAKATDYYTFKTNDKETWEPNFTFHGFRYIEISGCEKPALSDIKGYALASVSEETGSFTSSNSTLNQIYENTMWGQRSNFLSIPTDCPQRDERMGWGADTHVFAQTGLYNMDANMFYQKWLQDVRDGQYADGGYGDTAPNPHGMYNDVVWVAGGVIVPYDIWQMTGDTRILSDSYDSMKKYMSSRTTGGLVQSCTYGDWLEPVKGASDKTIIGTTYLAYQYSLMAQIADALGKSGEAESYRAKFEEVKAAFNSSFVRADGTIANGNNADLQSYYVLALGVGLATEETEPIFAQKLAERIVTDGGLMSVGFVSVNKLMPVLSKYGYNDIAYMLATSTKYPSWGYSIEQGATTLWERWNSYTKDQGFGPVDMNSFNHYSFGSVCEWFYSGIGGIKPDEQNPGFAHFLIEPELDPRAQNQVTNASTSYDSARGKIETSWSIGANDMVTLKVVVPTNSTATVLIPTTLETVSEGTGLFAKNLLDTDGKVQIDGVSGADYTEDMQKASIVLGSGSYEFQYKWKAPVSKTELAVALKNAAASIEIYEDWTDASAQAVRDAITTAQIVYDNADATTEQVTAQVSALQAAVGALEAGGNENLAAKKKATASSEVSATTFAPDKLTDGTRSGGGEATWSSNNQLTAEYHNEWAQIDLGSEKEFNRMLIFPRNDPADMAASGVGFPRDFKIQVSNDAKTWKTVITRTDYPAAGKKVDTRVQRFSFLKQQARYIKLDMTRFNITEGSSHRAQLAEIEVYDLATALGKTELGELIAQAKLFEEVDYTTESWATFASALSDAEGIYEKEAATGQEIEDAYLALQTAMDRLAMPDVATAANWIWDRPTGDSGIWSAFRKEVSLTADDMAAISGKEVIAQIAADSKYWLYINGELVVFEGSLKRGPNPKDTYVDKVDIAPYLKEGKNVIAALAWHFGMSTSYSHANSGQAGFYFDAKVNNTPIISNQSWKALNYDAYGKASKGPNYRLPESNVLFDARLEQEGWTTAEFDDSTWQAAQAFGRAGKAPWNNFVDRPIPMFAFDDYTVFDKDSIANKGTTQTSTLRNIVDEKGKPVSDYVLEAELKLDSGALGIVFGYTDGSNLNMWQIGYNTSPVLRPHVKKNGGWDVKPEKLISDVAVGDSLTHWFKVKLVVEGNIVTTYVDGKKIDVNEVVNTKGGIGLRASGQSGEKGRIRSLSVKSIDEVKTYYQDDFTNGNNFDGGKIEDGALVWDGSGTEVTVLVDKSDYVKYEAKLPTNFQFTPYLKVNGPAGKLIRISTDKTTVADGPAHMAEYVTKDGEQSYESLGWLNGDKLIFEIPKDVEILELGYRKSGYASTFDGKFESDDAFLNTLWTKARDTLYVTMRDNYMDCPDRERAQWWGDAVNEMEMAAYSLSPEAMLLAKKGIGNVLGFVTDDVIPTVAPTGGGIQELPAQSMAGVMSFYMYYEYTGDDSLLKEAYPVSANYLLKKFAMDADGVVSHRTGSWNWSDWGSNSDQRLISNLWYYIALDRTLKMADVIGVSTSDSQIVEIAKRKASIEANFERVFWNAGGFYRSPGVGVTDDRGNALAVFAGLVPEEKFDKVRGVLMSTQYASPYMEKYVLEALYLMGYENDALTRMKDRYTVMVDSELSTLWEFWDPNSGTQNHAWTGGPLTMMGRYIAGVAPVKPGFEEFSVKPQLGTVKKVDTVVPSVKGDINVVLDATGTDTLTMSTTVPTGTKAIVGVPLIGGMDATTISYQGTDVWANGKDVAGAAIKSVGADERYVYFESTKDIEFSAKRGEVHTLSVDVDDRINMQLFVNGVEKTMPYTYTLFAKDSDVSLRFVPKYDGEFAIQELTDKNGTLTIKPEDYMSPNFKMGGDYSLMGKVAYIGSTNLAKGARVTAEYAMRADTDPLWGANNLVDGIRTSQPGKSGFTTKEYVPQELENAHKVVLDLGKSQLLNSVFLYPRTDAATKDGKYPCYPMDFKIQLSENGAIWTDAVTRTNEPIPTADEGRGEYTFKLQSARYVRLATTKLGASAADEANNYYRMQLAEIEVFGETRTAQEIADTITQLTPPEKDTDEMSELTLPPGFTAEIASSSDETIIAKNGTIVPPENDTPVTLTYKITRLDGDTGQTQALRVTVPGMMPVPIDITTQPADASKKEGESAVFTVIVTGSYPHYQWQKYDKEWKDVPGATEATFTTDTLYVTDDGAKYRCAITNKASQNVTYSNEVKVNVTLSLPSAQEIADAITSVVAPQENQKQLIMPGVPPGFTLEIVNVTDVPVSNSGVITPLDAEQTGTIQFKVTRIADGSTATTAALPVTVPAKTTAAPDVSAQDIADGITSATAPQKDSKVFVLPGVPEGFTIRIASVDPQGVISTDGVIAPPNTDTDINVVFTVTKDSDGTSVNTGAITVSVPARTTVNLQTPTIIDLPTAEDLTYGQSLAQSGLNGGLGAVTGTFAWKNDKEVPVGGDTGAKAVFTPTDDVNYQPVEVTVPIHVSKATPVATELGAGTLIYGDKLKAGKLTAVVKNPHNNAVVSGVWTWIGDPSVRAVGGDKQQVRFTPDQAINYEVITDEVEITVGQAVPVVSVSVDPQTQYAEKDVTIKVTVTNPQDATFMDNLPEPKIEGVTLARKGNVYTGTYTIPADAEADKRIMFEANTEAVDAAYAQGRGQAFVTVANPVGGEDGKTVDITPEKGGKVPADVLDKYKGQDVTLRADHDGYTWKIDAKTITGALDPKGYDLSVTKLADPAVSKLTGGKELMQISIAHEGPLPFKAVLEMAVGAEHNGKEVYLYFVDEQNNKLVYQATCVVENGIVRYAFDHCSKYVISVERLTGNETSAPGKATPAPTTPQKGGAAKTGDMTDMTPWIIVVIAAAAVVAVVVIRLQKSRKKK